MDRVSPATIAEDDQVEEFLGQVRELLKSRTFAPLPVRERLIPKPNSSKLRRLGIPTAMDRVVQASLLLVLEPIFEADFKPVSYGFRPLPSAGRRMIFCSPACRQKAYRARGGHASGTTGAQRRRRAADHDHKPSAE